MDTINVEYINPFLVATVKVIRDACNLDIAIEKPLLKRADFTEDEFLVLMGITGMMKGQVILDFSEEGSRKIASQMCMMPIEELDEMAQSAVSELCNMILGNTATLFSSRGIRIDITPPTICTGNVFFSNSYAANICIPFTCSGRRLLDINIAVKGD